MKISASNANNESFEVEVLLSENEYELETGLISFSLGISRLIVEFTHMFAKIEAQATVLTNTIHNMVKDMVNEYIDSTFAEVTDLREERRLYAYMEGVFEGWLKDKHKTRDELAEKFQNVDTMRFDVIFEREDRENIVISLTNGDGSVHEILDTFPQALVHADPDLFERSVSMTYIVSVVISDLVFEDSEGKNPIRNLNNTPGYADGGLIRMIKNLLSQA